MDEKNFDIAWKNENIRKDLSNSVLIIDEYDSLFFDISNLNMMQAKFDKIK